MNAELSRRLAIVFNTPYYRYALTLDNQLGDKLTNQAVKADTFDKLPDSAKLFVEKAEYSIGEAKKLFPTIEPLFLTEDQRIQLTIKVENDYKQKQVS